jgi:hypothetical protein
MPVRGRLNTGLGGLADPENATFSSNNSRIDLAAKLINKKKGLAEHKYQYGTSTVLVFETYALTKKKPRGT